MSTVNNDGNSLKEGTDSQREEYWLLDFADKQRDYICRYTSERKILFGNESFCRDFRISKEDIRGHYLPFIIPEEDQERVTQHVSSFSVNNPEGMIDYRLIMPDGQIRWFRWNNYARFNDENEIIEYISVGKDITDLVQTIKVLKESEKSYREISGFSPDIIISLDKDLIPVYISPACKLITGYEPAEFIGRPVPYIIDTLFPEHMGEFEEPIQKTMRGETLNEIKLLIRRKDGTQVPVAIFSVPVVYENTILGSQVTVRDISGTVSTERKLRESEEKYRLLADNVHDVIWTADEQMHLTYITPSILKLRGFTPDEALTMSLRESLTHDSFQVLSDNYTKLKDAIDKGSPITPTIALDLEFYCKNGSTIWAEVMITAILDNNRKLVEFVGVTRDITQRRYAEEALIKANRQLSILSGITRHDILNKISALFVYLGLAELEYANPALSDYLRIIKTITHEIQSQIEFTRVYQDIGSLKPRWFLLDSVMPRSFFPISVTLTTDIQDLAVFADPMLEKVFYNLLDNSIHHGEKVTAISVRAHETDGNLLVIWEDNGVGISSDEKEHIFDREAGENPGFGLFLVREVLSLTGITIHENGKPGEGARFEIIVPKGSWRRSEA